MRITNNMMAASNMNSIMDNYSELHKITNQIDSGQLYTKPSDNPYGVSKQLDYNHLLRENERYKSNMESAHSQMTATDDALMAINNSLQRIRELTVTAASDTNAPEAPTAILNEIQENVKFIADTLNSEYNGNRLFGGYSTDPPVTEIDGYIKNNYLDTDGTTILKGDDDIMIEANKYLDFDINLNIHEVMDSEPSMSETLAGLQRTLGNIGSEDATVSSGEIEDYLDSLDVVMDHVSTMMVTNGNRMSRTEDMILRNEQETLNLQELNANETEVDPIEALIELTKIQTAYEASLQVGTKVMNQSLLDYI